MSIFDTIMNAAEAEAEAEAERKGDSIELGNSSEKAREAKAVLWSTIATVLKELSDDDRFDVASGTVNVLKPIVVMSAVGVRDIVDKQLDTLAHIDELAKESEEA